MSSDSGGLMSSAGLVRYFDAENSNAMQFAPHIVVGVGVFLGVTILMLNLIT